MNINGNWAFPTNVRFGPGKISELPEACMRAGMRNPLLITDKGLINHSITQGALDVLAEAGYGKSIFANVDANPNEHNLIDGIAAFKSGEHDGVVAFGGGSGIDLAKMVAFMAGQSLDVWEFEDVGDNWRRADEKAIAPSVAIPTTAGTGSEVGRASVITNSKTRMKKIIYHPKVLPVQVICDPELTTSMPGNITAGTGLDAFAHCVEAYSSPHYHPMCQGIALEGMRLAVRYLLRAFENGSDLEARAHMMSAAAMGATAFQKGLGAIHSMSHPVGACFNTHHGTTNAVCMPAVLEFNAPAIADRFNHAASYLGISGGFEGFCGFVRELNERLEIPAGLSEFGVNADHIPDLARDAIEDPSCAGNPVELTVSALEELYRSAL
ncbi:MAG: iron-containing alcohol dehydrogenase [Roseovarius sp.]|nr:iron-containing alcohol dehydrogenase [Roseovarius sp.]